MMNPFLKIERGRITSGGKPVMLRGVNLGGWLMMEGYIMHAPNRGVHLFKDGFKRALGSAALRDFEDSFRRNFIREEDFKNIKRLGFNCVRVPFHYRLIESWPYRYDQKGAAILDTVVRWGKKYKLWVILDLHAAPGAQNHDWHSDSDGGARLWTQKANVRRVCALWEFLADRYKREPWVAGYDLLNEAVLEDTKKLNAFYKSVIKAIRRVDKNHILFIEGNRWATDIGCLDTFDDDNYCLSVHQYAPLEVTFNFVPDAVYPRRGCWDKPFLEKILAGHARAAARHKAPVLAGEFGVNARDGHNGEDRWLADLLKCFADHKFHWTYWTYKAVKNHAFPDGLYSYYDNPPWVNRAGPLTGWETYAGCWQKSKSKMARGWRTASFKPNARVLKVLRNAV